MLQSLTVFSQNVLNDILKSLPQIQYLPVRPVAHCEFVNVAHGLKVYLGIHFNISCPEHKEL